MSTAEPSLNVACGRSNLEDAFAAGSAAARQALDSLGAFPPLVALAFAPARLDLAILLRGAAEALGEVPMFGITAAGGVQGNASLLGLRRCLEQGLAGGVAIRPGQDEASVLVVGQDLSSTDPVARENATLLREVEEMNRQLRDSSEEQARRIRETGVDLEKAIADHRLAESLVHFMTFHDPHTGLPNRNLFVDRLRQAFALALRNHRSVMVVRLDLDRFRSVLDGLGNGVGEEILKEVSERISACLRGSDTLAHLGRGEFALLLHGRDSGEDLRAALDRVRECVLQPLSIGGENLRLTSSVGCCLYPKDGMDADALLRSASVAVKRAKKKGGGCVQHFNADLQWQAEERVRFEMGLRGALEENALSLHYQAQVELESGRIAGVEALLRWRHPELGDIPPSRFIPLAEETGLIEPIGAWVLRQACLQAKAWQEAGLPPVRMAVNLSAKQLRKPGFESFVEKTLTETKLLPEFLELELTESASLEDPEQTIAFMNCMKEMGVGLSLDDFGTGFSNMHYLKQLPIDRLKLDGSFVERITTDPGSLTISDAIISMAHRLGLEVIAERAESEAQFALLKARGCDLIQGYYFSRPVPALECAELLRMGCFPVPRGGKEVPTLLVLDDEPNVTSALQRALRGAPEFKGWCCLFSNRVEEAFEMLALHRVSVILCDLRMPGHDGVEVLNRVKRMYPDTVRMVLSGHRDFDAAAAAINRGSVHKFLTKPVDFRELREVLTGALRPIPRSDGP